MNAKDFKTLTGENPKDMFGGDWEQELEDLELDPADIKKHQDECAGCAKCEV